MTMAIFCEKRLKNCSSAASTSDDAEASTLMLLEPEVADHLAKHLVRAPELVMRTDSRLQVTNVLEAMRHNNRLGGQLFAS